MLILASFIPNTPKTINGMICVALLGLGLIWSFLKTKNVKGISRALKEIDIFTILLLVGLFIVIGGITKVGVIEDISKIFINLSNDNLFVIYSLIVWASVLFSAFIDNIPYVATMLPVAAGIAAILNIEPYILYFGLLLDNTGRTLPRLVLQPILPPLIYCVRVMKSRPWNENGVLTLVPFGWLSNNLDDQA